MEERKIGPPGPTRGCEFENPTFQSPTRGTGQYSRKFDGPFRFTPRRRHDVHGPDDGDGSMYGKCIPACWCADDAVRQVDPDLVGRMKALGLSPVQ